MRSVFVEDFSQWRGMARLLLAHEIHPAQILWNPTDSGQQALFEQAALPPKENLYSVSKQFLTLAEKTGAHRNPDRWQLLYHTLWRLTHGERHLLRISTDPVIHALEQMEKAVRRDMHKTKAFVRFRLTEEEGAEHYIAWHRPDHRILRLVAPFFQRRFTSMHWTILTPDESVHWNGETLRFGPGVPADQAPPEDVLEDLWRDYYRATFNPARIMVRAMKREMPVRHWATLPETRIIQDMLNEAPERVAAMLKHQEGMATSAADFLPPPACRDLPSLRDAAMGCEGCPLHTCASRTVFGEGVTDAKLMLVGEQPGDEEDKAGKPFVGPAGQVLDQALTQAGVPREALYITNAVKHFKFRLQDGQRYHRTPTLQDVTACKPWVEAEIAAVKPKAILGLGVTAARALISPGFTLKEGRTRWQPYGRSLSELHSPAPADAPGIAATFHPSAILRAPDRAKQEEMFQMLVQDLSMAWEKSA